MSIFKSRSPDGELLITFTLDELINFCNSAATEAIRACELLKLEFEQLVAQEVDKNRVTQRAYLEKMAKEW